MINYNLMILDIVKVMIGDYVMIGFNVDIYMVNYFFDKEGCCYYYVMVLLVMIGNDVWIGGKVMILLGVMIGDNVVVVVGVVVIKDVFVNIIVVGVLVWVIKEFLE